MNILIAKARSLVKRQRSPPNPGVIKATPNQPAARLVKSPAKNLVLGTVKTLSIKSRLAR